MVWYLIIEPPFRYKLDENSHLVQIGGISVVINLDWPKIFSSILIHVCFELLIFKSACPAARFDTSNEVLGQEITKYDYLIWHSSEKRSNAIKVQFSFFFAFGSMPDINSLNSNEVSGSFLKPLLNKSFTKVLQGKTVSESTTRIVS